MYIEVQSMKNRILHGEKAGVSTEITGTRNVSGKTVESMCNDVFNVSGKRVPKAGEGLWSGVYRKDADRRFDMKHIDEVEKMVI